MAAREEAKLDDEYEEKEKYIYSYCLKSITDEYYWEKMVGEKEEKEKFINDNLLKLIKQNKAQYFKENSYEEVNSTVENLKDLHYKYEYSTVEDKKQFGLEINKNALLLLIYNCFNFIKIGSFLKMAIVDYTQQKEQYRTTLLMSYDRKISSLEDSGVDRKQIEELKEQRKKEREKEREREQIQRQIEEQIKEIKKRRRERKKLEQEKLEQEKGTKEEKERLERLERLEQEKATKEERLERLETEGLEKFPPLNQYYFNEYPFPEQNIQNITNENDDENGYIDLIGDTRDDNGYLYVYPSENPLEKERKAKERLDREREEKAKDLNTQTKPKTKSSFADLIASFEQPSTNAHALPTPKKRLEREILDQERKERERKDRERLQTQAQEPTPDLWQILQADKGKGIYQFRKKPL